MTERIDVKPTVRLTHLGSGTDFEIGPKAGALGEEVARQVYGRISREVRAGRELVECREHDDSDDPELARRRNAATGRVHGILVYLQKHHEGTAREHWRVVHFDGRATHRTPGKGLQHQREQDAWTDAAEAAGYAAEQEVRLSTGVRCDVLIRGPVIAVDIEVQHSPIKVASIQGRTRKIQRAGITPIWSTEQQTDWTRRNSVPHVRTNALPEWHGLRDNWLVVGGVRNVVARRCSPMNFDVCPDTRLGKFCGRFHPVLEPKEAIRVYEVAEKAPAGALVALEAGKRQGVILVTPDHAALWRDLTTPPPTPRSDVRPKARPEQPYHRQNLRPGFGSVIDSQRVLDAAVPRPPRCSHCRQAPPGPGGVLCPECRDQLHANRLGGTPVTAHHTRIAATQARSVPA